MQHELRDALSRPSEDEEAKEAFQLKIREIDALKNELASLKAANAKEKEAGNQLRNQVEDEHKRNGI